MPVSLSILILVVIVVLAAMAARMLPADPSGPPGDDYQRGTALFTAAERSFLGVLEQALGGRYRVFGKVRIADVVSVKASRDRRAWQRAFNRISAKHFDFVLCDPGDLSVVAVIELDDASHRAKARQDRDTFVEALCSRIGLPLIRVPARAGYSIDEIRQRIDAALAPVPAVVTPAALPDRGGDAAPAADASTPVSATNPVVAAASPPACPACSSTMVMRRPRSKASGDRRFWGCSSYPRCRGVVPISD